MYPTLLLKYNRHDETKTPPPKKKKKKKNGYLGPSQYKVAILPL